MAVTTLSSREFDQDLGRAKRAAKEGPVVITDRGTPSHVLLTVEAYKKLSAKPRNLVDALAMPRLSDINFEPEAAEIKPRIPDFS